jgi:hypothetical protein
MYYSSYVIEDGCDICRILGINDICIDGLSIPIPSSDGLKRIILEISKE